MILNYQKNENEDIEFYLEYYDDFIHYIPEIDINILRKLDIDILINHMAEHMIDTYNAKSQEPDFYRFLARTMYKFLNSGEL